MSFVKTSRRCQSDLFLAAIADYDSFVVVMHDTPDPDAIASAWAIGTLIEAKLNKRSRLIGGGAIVRAENRHMVDLLGPPIQLVAAFDADETGAPILVDSGSSSSNQMLSRSGSQPVAIIDHHINSCKGASTAFIDVRPDVAATATIAASYLREQNVDPGMKLATALLYAIRTETRGSETSYSPLDQDLVIWLTEQADPELLAAIESAPLSREWYSNLVLALQCTTVFGDAALCFLPQAEGAEIVGEMADLLVRGRGIRRVMCAAVNGKDLLISVRTTPDAENAADLVVATIDELGSGGGHARRAGGKIPEVVSDGDIPEALESELRARWIEACRAQNASPQHLVSWRDIVEHI